MVIQKENKTLAFTVLGYQYPNAVQSAPDGLNHDANWLNVKIEYSEENFRKSYEDSCVLTWELAALADSLQKMTAGQETSFVSDFLEPYLHFAVTKAEDGFSFQVRFACDVTENGKEISVTQLVSKQQLSAICDELKEVLSVYPER